MDEHNLKKIQNAVEAGEGLQDSIASIKAEFDQWNNVKINLELHGRQPNPSQGEIWWAGVGRNLGTEMNGKNHRFARPVLIYKKLSRYGFMAIPLTSKIHIGSWYVSFMQNKTRETAMLHQVKTMNVRRLYSRMGRIDESDLLRIKGAFARLYC